MNKDNRRHLKNLYINKEIQNKVICWSQKR
jgi:hypothetical protein